MAIAVMLHETEPVLYTASWALYTVATYFQAHVMLPSVLNSSTKVGASPTRRLRDQDYVSIDFGR